MQKTRPEHSAELPQVPKPPCTFRSQTSLAWDDQERPVKPAHCRGESNRLHAPDNPEGPLVPRWFQTSQNEAGQGVMAGEWSLHKCLLRARFLEWFSPIVMAAGRVRVLPPERALRGKSAVRRAAPCDVMRCSPWSQVGHRESLMGCVADGG